MNLAPSLGRRIAVFGALLGVLLLFGCGRIGLELLPIEDDAGSGDAGIGSSGALDGGGRDAGHATGVDAGQIDGGHLTGGGDVTLDDAGGDLPVDAGGGSVSVDAGGSGSMDGGGGDLPADASCDVASCPTSSCTDGMKNGFETDTDCGGGECPACGDNAQCASGLDCTSRNCVGGECLASSCSDGVTNGSELDVDCGGSCPTACGSVGSCAPGCGLGDSCTSNSDCSSGRCEGSVCVAALPTSCAGSQHACAISDGGRVLCWGDDTYGALGDNESVDYRTGPVYVQGLTDATTLACGQGGSHTCAVRKTGQVVCWGYNIDGQLGDGTTTRRDVPTLVPGITNAVQVSAGTAFSCALLANSEVQCWGAGLVGQLGRGDTKDGISPAAVSGGETGATRLASAVFLASGEKHSCAVLDGARGARVACWGEGATGRLGNGSTSNALTPVYVHGVGNTGVCNGTNSSGCLANAGMVAAGQDATLVIHAGGLVSSCGANTSGESGSGQQSNTPVRVSGVGSGTLDDASFVAMGQNHGCAVLGGGALACWGSGASGRLGVGTTTTQASPKAVVGGTGYEEVVTGDAFSCGRLAADGTMRCWGNNPQGQLADGSLLDRSEPVEVSGVRDVETIRAGFEHSCAVSQGGSLYCFGSNANYELGLGDVTARWAPRLVPSLSGVVDVAPQRSGTCVLLEDGTVRCWGYDGSGQNGDGQIGSPGVRPEPVKVVGIQDAVQLVAGEYHACALIDPAPVGTGDTQVRCWGYNPYGQLGNGTITSSATPVQVLNVAGTAALNDAVALGAGWNHTCAVLRSGGVVCWGYNSLGQLGDGTITNRNRPVAVQGVNSSGTLAGIASGSRVIDAGAEFTCALAQTGALYCWGDGNLGELGHGVTEVSRVPVQVALITDARSVAANSDPAGHACAVRTAGVDCWGYNALGQVGDGTLTQRTRPVRVQLSEAAAQVGNPDLAAPVISVATGQNHSLAGHSNGLVSAWGYGASGRLGTGRPDQEETPRAVCVQPIR